MKKTKVIIPALGMLLLSTAASVTGTVAWFAANASVTATGMNITASTDSEFLVISRTSTLGTLETVAIENPASGAVLPTAWVNNTGWNWVTATGTSTSNGAKTGDFTNLTISESGHFGSASGKHYYVYDSVFVGLAAGSSIPTGKKLVCDATFDAVKSSALNACLTVGLSVGGAPTADFNKKFVMGSDSADPVAIPHLDTDSLIPGASLGTTGTEIKIFAYYDGENPACKTENAINLDAITISFTFRLVDAE